LYFSYWIDYLGFITEGKLAAILIKPSLGVSNWPVILLHQQTQSSFLASSSPRHQVPPGVQHKMDMHRASFLWSGDRNKKKYHLVSWPVVYLPKDLGGLGILDLDVMNISLLSKWLWKLFNEKGDW
jgi:hypothetical protein